MLIFPSRSAGRIGHVLLAVVLAVVPWAAGADTIHARATSDGLTLQVAPLVPGGAATFEETSRTSFLDGYINSPPLRAFGFTQSLPGNAFPIEHQLTLADGVIFETVLDATSRGAVEGALTPPSDQRDRRWDMRSTSETNVTFLLSPASVLTASTHATSMLDLDDPEPDQYQARAGWTLSFATLLGSQAITGGIAANSAQEFPLSREDELRLVIANPTDAPLFVFLQSTGEVTATWLPSTTPPVPEPSVGLMLALGLLGLALHARRRGSERMRQRGHAWAAWAAAALLPTAAGAQTLDITATMGAVLQTQDANSAEAVLRWDHIDMFAQVRETGFPHVGEEREAIGTIPSPLALSPESGHSWVDFRVAGPSAPAALALHLEEHEPHPVPGSFGVAEIRGTLANIAVPPHTIARLGLQITVIPDLPDALGYGVTASMGQYAGVNYWITSADGPRSTTLLAPDSYDNQFSDETLNTGPVYFVGNVMVNLPQVPVPEPSGAALLVAGLVLILHVLRRRRAPARAGGFRAALALAAAFGLASGAAQAEVRSTALLTVSQAELRYADGAPYVLPFDFDRHHSNGVVLTELGPDRRIDFFDGYYRWGEGFCEGNCPSNFPPIDNNVPPGGYARTETQGNLQLGSTELGSTMHRADAAATGPRPTSALTSSSYTLRLVPDSSRPLVLTLEAAPYIDEFLAPGTPTEVGTSAEMRFQISLRNVTTGADLFTWADEALNRNLFLEPQPEGASLIYAPGTHSYRIDLAGLAAGNSYDLHFDQQVVTRVLVAVPEPASAALYGAGLGLFAVAARRRRRHRFAAAAGASGREAIA